MNAEIQKAINLRKQDQPEAALTLLKTLLEKSPNDPNLNFQTAWTCDSMGAESAAVPYYETAIENGLAGEDLEGALLGLGSTYRCLGRYKESLATFDRAITEFPNNRALKVFRCLTLHNLGQYEESLGDLLVQLLDTTADKNISSYENALRFYSDKLSETWT